MSARKVGVGVGVLVVAGIALLGGRGAQAPAPASGLATPRPLAAEKPGKSPPTERPLAAAPRVEARPIDSPWQRQYLRLRDCLLLFEQGKLELRELVANASALIAALEQASDADRRALQNAWWHLEEVVAQPDLTVLERQTSAQMGTRLLGELLGTLINVPSSPERRGDE